MNMKKKICSESGETLVETVIAIFIISLVSALLASMVMTTSKINTVAQKQDQILYEAENALDDPATPAKGGGDGDVNVTVGANSVTKRAKFYQDAEGKLFTYRMEADA